MVPSFNIRNLTLGCALLAAVSTQVHAGSVTLSLPGSFSTALNPGLDSDLSVNFQHSGAQTVAAGAINFAVTSSSDANIATGSLTTFCIQGRQDVYLGSTNDLYSVQNLNTPGTPWGAADAGILNSTSALDIQGFANSYFDAWTSESTAEQKNIDAAAFQLGLWELEYDHGTVDFASGDLIASGLTTDGKAAVTRASSWLSNYTPATSVTSLALVSNSLQDQFVYVPGGSTPNTPSPVPLPAALPAGLSLLGGLFAARKVRRKLA